MGGPWRSTILPAMQQPPYNSPAPQPLPYGNPEFSGVPVRKGSWVSRHAGWAVSIGCLGIVLLGASFFIGVFAIVTTALRSSDAYSVAMNAAEHDPTVLAELGAPVKAGWFVSGSINTSGSSGHADISIPVSGSVRSGKVNAVANKASGTWTFSTLNVVIDGHLAPIDLLPSLPAP